MVSRISARDGIFFPAQIPADVEVEIVISGQRKGRRFARSRDQQVHRHAVTLVQKLIGLFRVHPAKTPIAGPWGPLCVS